MDGLNERKNERMKRVARIAHTRTHAPVYIHGGLQLTDRLNAYNSKTPRISVFYIRAFAACDETGHGRRGDKRLTEN